MNLKNLLTISAISGCFFTSAYAQENCSNFALNKPVVASSTWSNETANKAFDGNLTTNWSADQHTGWIQVDLQNKVTVDSMKLYVNQYYPGNTIHEILTSEDMVNWTIVHTISEYTINNQILSVKFNPGLSNVRGVKINTTSSNSWVAWYEIEVFANPYKPTITHDGLILSSSSESNNQWYLNGTPIPGANSQTFTAINSGSYQVGVSYGNGCVSMSDIASIITTEIDITSKNRLKVYPNPTTDYIIIEGITNANIEIFNLQGQIIKNVNTISNKSNIDISNIPNGIYSIRITTTDGIFVHKMVKDLPL